MNFLLLGHQRAGTSFFLDLLRHNVNIDTINEPFSMHLDFFRENEQPWTYQDYNENYLHTIRIRCINNIILLQVKVKTKINNNNRVSEEYEKILDIVKAV